MLWLPVVKEIPARTTQAFFVQVHGLICRKGLCSAWWGELLKTRV